MLSGALQRSMLEDYRRRVSEKREEVARLQAQRDELLAAQKRLRELCELKAQVRVGGADHTPMHQALTPPPFQLSPAHSPKAATAGAARQSKDPGGGKLTLVLA